MNNLPPNQWSDADFAQLEQLIGGAKNFVVPSEQLRPQVVEAARAIDARQAQLAKLRTLVICVFCVWLLVLGTFWSLRSRRTEFTSPTSAEVEQMSVDYATQRRYSKDWGMVDVFWELRGGDSKNTSPPQPRLQPAPAVVNE
jgi:hypothetical protein